MAALVVGSGVLGSPPAHAAGCTGSAGVTVLVDFAPLGGGVRTGCAPGDPTSGLDALARAGFAYTTASRQAGFVCRINGAPASDPCVTASPIDAYWSYWHARPGGSWSYSTVGAAVYDPAPGSVEGWAFGAGGQPSVHPPAPPATAGPTSPPAGTSAPPDRAQDPPPAARGPGRPGTPSGTTGPGSATTAHPGRTPAGAATPTAARTTGSAAPGGSAPGSPAPGDTAGAPATRTAAAPSRTGGSLAGTLAGAALVAVLGGVAVWTARRRAHRRPG